MLYLNTVIFPDDESVSFFIAGIRRTCYDSFYPFKVLSRNRFERIDFEPVTICYSSEGVA